MKKPSPRLPNYKSIIRSAFNDSAGSYSDWYALGAMSRRLSHLSKSCSRSKTITNVA
jgi:hypothetical protein